MAELIGYLAHLGIVRVLSVPAVMAVMLYLVYRLAAPREDLEEDDGQNSHA